MIRLRACWVVQAPSGCGVYPEDVHAPGPDLHHEQDVQPLEEDGVHGEEVAGQQAFGLGAQELLPGRIGAAGCGGVVL
jgi:hypothetical protein